jgi:hypothetical protein
MDPHIPSLEVTLRHESFGEFAFRCEPDEVGNVVEDMLEEAKKSHDMKAAIAAVDQDQARLSASLVDADARISAARLLGDTALIAREEAARADIEDSIAACSTRRASLALK